MYPLPTGIQGGDDVRVASETYLHVKGLASPGSLIVKVTDPDGQAVPVSSSPSDNPTFHTFRYVPTKPGKHTINIAKEGVPVRGSPFFPDIIEVDPSKCVAEGPGLLKGKVGKPANFTVNCHRAGPGKLKVDIKSSSGTDILTTISGTEKFDIAYTPSEIGPHNIVVLFANHQIKGSPFTAIVTDPSKVIVEGLHDCKMNENAQFHVETEEAGPGKPDVSVRGPTGPIPCTMEDLDENVYKCTYTPVEAGPHTIDVRFAEKDVSGSPFTTTVSEPCYPDKVVLRHLPRGNLQVRHEYSITADATKGGSGTLSATLNGPSDSIPCSLQEAPLKIYSIKFVPTESGKHELEVLFSGIPVPNSPALFNVVDPSNIQVTPPTAGDLGVFITDQPYKYHVKAPDTAEKVTARARGRNIGEEPTLNLTETGVGECNITLTAAKPDDYDVDIYYGSDPVPGSPYHLQVVEKPHPDNVQCGPLLPEVPVSMNVDISRAGAGKLTATCKGDKCGAVPCTISDAGPGKQQVSFDPPAPDVYWVSVYWNGTEVPRSPFRVNTVPTNAGKVCVDGPHHPQMHEGPVMAVCDVTDAGDGNLTASCYSKELGEVFVQVSKKVDGKIEVQFAPPGPGQYRLNVKWQDNDVPGSPFIIGLADPSKCIPDGPGLLVGKVGRPAHFTVDCHRAGPGELKVDIMSPSGVSMPATISDTEKHDIVYVPSEIGPHNIVVQYADQQIQGSPFTAIVTNPSNVIVEELCDCKMDETAQFCVQTEEAGPGKPDVSVRGPTGPIPFIMKDVNEHVYQCTYTPVEAGLHTIRVCFAEEDVPGSPFTTTVSEPCYPDKVVLRHLPHGNLRVRQEYSITADATKGGSGTLSATLNGLSHSIPCSLQEEPLKIYSVKFVPTESGKHELEVLFSGIPVPNSPALFNVVDPLGIQVTPPSAGDLGVFITDQPYKYYVKAPDTAEKVTARAHGRNTGEQPIVNLTESGEGEYNITLTAAKPDDYDVDIYYGSDPVPGSPYHLQVVEKPHPDHVQCGPLLPEVPATMNVDISRAGAGKLTATCKGDKCGAVPCTISDAGPGKQQVSFDPPAPDVYWVSVYWNGTEVPRSPFRVNTIPTDASKVVVDGPHHPQMHEGPVMAVCDVTDAGDGDLTAVCYSEELGEVPVQVSKKVDGKIEVQFAPPGPGQYRLNVKWQDNDVPGSPFIIGLADPSKCIPDGAGLLVGKVGRPAHFTVDCHRAGPGKLRVDIMSPSGVSMPATISGTEKHDIVYVPSEIGPHNIVVQYADQQIQGSPFTAIVTNPSNVIVEELCDCKMDETAQFCVQTEEAGPGKPDVSVRGPTGPIPFIMKDVNEHVYQCTYTPVEAGLHTIRVCFAEEDVPGSPFTTTVSEPCYPDKVVLRHLPHGNLRVRQEYSITADATKGGSGTLSATLNGPSDSIPCSLQEAPLKIYSIKFVPTESGKHELEVLFSGIPVPNSPALFNVVDPSNIQVTPPTAGDLGVFITDQPYKYHVKAPDTAEKVTARAHGRNTGEQPIVNLTESGDGEYNITLTTAKPDDYDVDIYYGSDPVPGSPYQLEVVEKPHPDHVQCGPLLPEVPATMNVDTSRAGAGKLTATCKGDKCGVVRCTISDTGPGKQQVSFDPPAPDVYWVSVYWNDTEVPRSPFRVNTVPTNAGKVCVDGPHHPQMHEGPVTAVCDVTDAGDGDLTAVCYSEEYGEVPVQVSKKVDGKIEVQFAPPGPGQYQLNVKWLDDDVPGCPFIIGLADPSKCIPDGPGLLVGKVGRPAHFTVDCHRAGPGKLKVDIKSPSGVNMPATISGTKEFDIVYMPSETGPHNIVVQYADQQIQGSPFTAIVTNPSLVNIEGLCDCKMDETAQFCVQTEEAGPGKPDVRVRGPTGPIPCTMEDVNEHVYQCMYTPVAAGTHIVIVRFAEEDVPGSPFTTTVSEPCYPDQVVLRHLPHSNLRVRQEYSITADATKGGSGTLSATLNGPSDSIPCSLQEEPLRVYSIRFVPAESGKHELAVLFSGTPVPDSPVLFHVVDPIGTLVTPPTAGVLGVFITDQPYKYYVKAPDTAEKVTARAHGRNTCEEPTVNLTESGDGEYDITLTAAKPDDYDVDIYYGSDPVPGSPYHLQVVEKPHPDHVQCGPLQLLPEVPVTMNVDISRAGAGKLTATCKGDKCGAVPCTISDAGPGKQQVSFDPPAPDVYWVSVYWNGTEVPRSPFPVSIITTDASKVVVDGPYHPQMHEGPVMVVCDVTDAGDGKLSASCYSKEHGEVLVQVSKKVDGKIQVRFIPPDRGHYKLNVMWQDDNIPRSPFTIKLDPPNPFKVQVDGPNIKYASETSSVLDQVHTYIDASAAGDGALVVSVEGESTGSIEVSITDKGSKNYEAVFDAIEPDIYNVSVLWDQQHVLGSPFSLFTVKYAEQTESSYLINGLPYEPGEDSAYHELEFPESVSVFEVGEPLTVIVDKGDNSEESTGHVTASCQGDTVGQIPVEVITNPDGSEQININPQKSDLYTVVIKMGDKDVPSSPFKVQYLPPPPPPTDASKCKVYGLPAAEMKLVPYEEIVYLVDASEAGAGNLSVRSQAPSESKRNSELQIMSKDGADFRIAYTPGAAGTHRHFIYWSKEAIPESPVVFEIEPRDIPEYHFGPVTMEFVFPGIKARGVSGHVIYEPTGKKLNLNVKKSKTERDKFQVSFKPTNPGLYEVYVNNRKVPVKGSPFEVRVLERVDASKVRVTGLTGIVCHVGDKVPFVVDYTNAGSGSLLVTAEGPISGGEQEPIDFGNKTNSCSDGTFLPSSEGDHLVHVSWSDKPVPGSPFKVKVVPNITILELGQTMDIKVTDKADDEVYGIAVGDNTGPAHVSVQLDEDNRHQALFQPLYADDYKLTVMLNDSHIDGSPFHIKVLEKTTLFVDAEEGAPQKDLEAEANKPVNFVFRPGPINNTPAMSVHGPSGPLSAKVSHTGEGRYIAHFKPTEKGEYLVSARSNGKHLKGSPYTVLVHGSAAEENKKHILTGLELHKVDFQVNKPCKFKVHCDKFSEGDFSVTVEPPSAANITTRNLGDLGRPLSYHVTLVPKESGEYKVSATYNNEHIQGSPFLCTFNHEEQEMP